MAERLNSKSKRFSWTALAQYNEDQAKKTVSSARRIHEERRDYETRRRRIAKAPRTQIANEYIKEIVKGRVSRERVPLKEYMRVHLGDEKGHNS